MKLIKTAIIFLVFFLSSFIFVDKAFAQQVQALLSCSPSTGTVKVGEVFTVDYVMDTRGNQVFGAEVLATYTNILESVGSQSTLVTNNTNWTTAFTNTIDVTLNKIHLDFGNSQPAFTGNSAIGQITFRAKNEGQAQFNFTFFQQYDDTTPGVAKVWGKRDGVNLSNVLSNVSNCIYVIEATASATPAPTSSSVTPTPTTPPIGGPTSIPTISELPRAGHTEVTFSLLLLVLIFAGMGIIVPVVI